MSTVSEDRQQTFSPGLAIKQSCRVASTAAIAFVAGTPQGLLVIDGVQLVANDRVLIKNQVDATQNGIWVASSGNWVRSVDFDGIRDVAQGTAVLVRAGAQAGTFFQVTAADPITPGTTAITFAALLTGPALAFPVVVGQIPFGIVGNALAQDANLFWDNVNKRLGIGNAAPTVALDVTGAIKASLSVAIFGGAAPGVGTAVLQGWIEAGAPALSFVDPTRTANNRIAELVWSGGALLGRFVNDAYGAVVTWLTATGGQAAGVTGITLGGPTTTGALTAPSLDSGSGSLILKGAGTTAQTITGANSVLAGTLTATLLAISTAVGKIIPGATSVSHRNNADTFDNVLISDAGNMTVRGTLTGGAASMLAPITNSLGGDVALNNTANYFDGPSVAQGSVGTWYVSGTVTITDTGGAANIDAKLWDGTTVIASGSQRTVVAGGFQSISLSGFITSPAGNLRISVKDSTAVTGKIVFNNTGNNKDSTITAFRIA